jgi:hypothetical protein
LKGCATMTFYAGYHQGLTESLPPEEAQSKTIESVLLDADASEVLRLFHDKVRPYSNYQYFKKHKKDGEEKEFSHTFLKIETQNNRRLEVLEVIYPEKYEGKPKSPIHRKALIIQVWQIGKRVKIVAEFYPFFDKLIVDELSNFEQLPKKESQTHTTQEHKSWVWELMEGATDKDKELVKDWCTSDLSGPEIAEKHFLAEGTIYNYLGQLRETYPDLDIPKGASKRREYREKWLLSLPAGRTD